MKRRLIVALLGLTLALAPLRGSLAATPPSVAPMSGATDRDAARTKEYGVKVAFLYNFLKYTEWPAGTFDSPEEPIVLGVVGPDPFGTMLDKSFHRKRVGKRSVIIRRFERYHDVRGVHTLFVGELKRRDRSALYAKLIEQPILTIGDRKGLAGRDSCVASFFVQDGKVRFEISTEAIDRARLSISSQLLKLADVVEKRR